MNDKNSKSRSLILITTAIAVAILAASWFLLISPVLNGAAEANTNAQAQEDTNANTQVEVNKLREQYTHIDEFQTQLAALQTQIPTAPMYPDLQQMFAAIAAKHHVVITALQFGAAAPFAAAAAPPATDGTEGATPAPSPSPSPAPTAGEGTTPGLTAPAGMYGIPVSVTVEGKYDDVTATLKELQTGPGRLVFVSNVTITRGLTNPAAAAPGVSGGASTDIDTTGVFEGLTYVLTSSTPTEEAPAGTSPSPSPTPAP